MTGDVTVDVGHAGGEFAELLAIGEDLFGPPSRYALCFIDSLVIQRLTPFCRRVRAQDYRT